MLKISPNFIKSNGFYISIGPNVRYSESRKNKHTKKRKQTAAMKICIATYISSFTASWYYRYSCTTSENNNKKWIVCDALRQNCYISSFTCHLRRISSCDLSWNKIYSSLPTLRCLISAPPPLINFCDFRSEILGQFFWTIKFWRFDHEE